MANRYWVGGNDTWDATAGSKWSTTSGGSGGAAVPTNADDVFLDGNSGASTVTIGTGYTAVPKTLTCTGFTGTLAGDGNLTVAGSVTFVAGMTITATGTLTITTTATLTSAGKTWTGNLRLTAGGITYTLADTWAVAGSVTLGNNGTGITTINGNQLQCLSDCTLEVTSGRVTGTTTLVLKGTGTFSNSSTAQGLQLDTVFDAGAGTVTLATTNFFRFINATMTYTSGTVVTTGVILIINLTVAGSNATLDFNGMLWEEVLLASNGTITLLSELNCNTLNLGASGTSTVINGSTIRVAQNITTSISTGTTSGTTAVVMEGTGTLSTPSATSGRIGLNLEINTAGTITIDGTVRYGGAIFKYTSGTLAGSSTPTLSFVTSSTTWTNNAAFTLTSLAVVNAVTLTVNGTHGFSIGSFTCTTAGITHTFAAGKTYIFNSNTTQLTLTGTNASRITFVSSSGGSQAILTFVNNGALNDVGFVNATDIDSSQGQTVWDWGGTLSNASNWQLLTTPKTVGYASVV